MRFMTAGPAPRLAFAASTLLISLAMLFVAPPALSADDDYGRSGMYLGASVVGGSHVRLDQIAGGPEAEESAGFRVYGGYRISEAFAFEMEFDMLPVANVDTTGINGVADLESYSVTANSKIFWLQERIQPYTIVGFGILHTRFRDTQGGGIDGSDFGAAFRFGAGLDFYITKHIVASAGAGYVLPVAADVEDRDVVTYGGGIQYRF